MADAVTDAKAALAAATAARDQLKVAADQAAADAAAAPGDAAAGAAAADAATKLAAATVDLARRQVDLDTALAVPPAATVPPAAPDPVDLSTIKSNAPASAAARTPDKVVNDVKVDITDSTRRNLAYALIAILFMVIVFHFVRSYVFDGQCPLLANAEHKLIDVEQTTKLCEARTASYNAVASQTQTVFTALIGLVGSVVGFYFGQKSAQPN